MEQDKILELKGEIITLKEKLNQNKKEYNELLKNYINLRARYSNQNNELCRLKIVVNDLKGGKNDNN